MRGQGRVRVGTSGWIYKHWRGLFYPERLSARRWFAFYAERFDTVEINNTFYRLPAAGVFAEWRGQAPPGFLYAVKASRFLTHMKKLKDPEEPLETILGRARGLGPHLGPVLYQLPPHWGCDAARLEQFIVRLPRDLTHVFAARIARNNSAPALFGGDIEKMQLHGQSRASRQVNDLRAIGRAAGSHIEDTRGSSLRHL